VSLGRRLAWFALALALIDAGAVAVLHAGGLPISVGPGASAAATPAAPPPPPNGRNDGWALCQTRYAGREVTPAAAAITYLEAVADRAVTAPEIRGWLGDLDPSVVDVYLLEDAAGVRRISIEVSRARWRRWDEVAGSAVGDDACSILRAELLAHGVGRPRDAAAAAAPASKSARYDFELIYARRPSLYTTIAWVGTLDAALEERSFTSLMTWLAAGRDARFAPPPG
jgi:hypothetical protein